jgi:hypothetical protein
MGDNNEMTVPERIEVLEKGLAKALRETSIVSLQLLVVTATTDEANYPRIKKRLAALDKIVNGAAEEIERLVEEQRDGQGGR